MALFFRRSTHCSSHESARSKTVSSLQPRGPGLLESVGWLLGSWGLQLLGVAATAGLLASFFISAGLSWNDLEILEYLASHPFTLLAGQQFVFVTGVLLLAWWRLRGDLGHRLGSRPLAWQHLFLLTCLVVPLATISGVIHSWGMQIWSSLLESVPALSSFDVAQPMEFLDRMSMTSSTGALVLIFAVAPALAEEIVFRGLIGRGLIQRWGLIIGVLLTSILFAVAHLHPVHALAVFPIGIVLHYVYMTTRSFWAPLYLHFCNNAYAVLQVTERPLTIERLDLPSAVTVILSLVLFLALLWVSRVRCLQENGKEWTPRRPSLELPVEMPVTLTFSTLPWRLTVGGLVPLIGFFAAVARANG